MYSFYLVHCIFFVTNMELNDLRIIIVAENLKFLLKEFEFVMSLKNCRSLLRSETNGVIHMLLQQLRVLV